MARIRTIKPEFFTSETVLGISHSARLTFVGLWTHCDDAGRARDDPRIIKGALWPIEDEVTWKDVAAHLDELDASGVICRYEHGGKRYLHVVTWREHQVIQKPSQPRHPECHRETHGGPPPSSDRATGGLQEDAGSPPEIPGAGSRKWDLGKGKGKGVGKGADAPVAPSARPVSVDRQVFDFWREARAKNGRVEFNDARKRAVAVALKAYPLEDLLDAIRGIAADERRWPDRALNDDLLIALRLGGRGNRNNLEYFRDLYRLGGVLPERPPRMPADVEPIVPDEDPLPQESRPGYAR